MKRFIQLALVSFLIFGFSSTSLGQDITASATVSPTVSVTSVEGLTFGSVTTGTENIVNIDDEDAGTFTVKSNASSVELSFNQLTELSGNNSGETMSFSFASDDGNDYAGWSDENNPSDNTFDASSGTTINFITNTDDNEITVYVGGVVSPSETQAADTYEGTITLTAEYN